jgi:hypothetical protein
MAITKARLPLEIFSAKEAKRQLSLRWKTPRLFKDENYVQKSLRQAGDCSAV